MENIIKNYTEIDEIIYYQLKNIQKNGFSDLGFVVNMPSNMISLKNLKLIDTNMTDLREHIQKSTLKIYITELGLNSIINYEKKIEKAKNEYFLQQISNIKALNISEERRAEIFMILEIMKISSNQLDLKESFKLIKKSMKKDKTISPFLSSIISSLISNYITSIFFK